VTLEILLKGDTFCISRKNLAIFLGVSKNQIVSYGKPNIYSPCLETLDKDFYDIKGNEVWYDFKYAIIWHRDIIYQKYSPKDNKYTGLQSEDDYSDYDPYVDKITTSNMKVAKELENALNEKIKREKEQIELKVAKGLYVPADVADKAVVETAVMMLSDLQNLKDVLPPYILPCKTVDEVGKVLDIEFEKMVNGLNEKVNNVK